MTNQTFEQLKKTYESGRTRPLAWRRAQLNALRRLVTENRDAFVSSAMADLGKPAAETVLMELNLVAGEAQFVRNRLSLWTARHPKAMHWMLQPAAGWTIAEPKGVVLIISPWNYPVLLALEPMADALAAGNAVCLKPSELSPNTSKLLAELVPQYLDSEAVRVVEGGPKETGELLKCPFNHIFYTGGGHVRQNRHARGGQASDAGHAGTRRQVAMLCGSHCGHQCGCTPHCVGQIHQCRADLRGTRLCARHAGCGRGSGRAHRRSHHRILWRRSEGLA